MKKELPKAYEPAEYEDKIYRKWEKSGFFQPGAGRLLAKNKGDSEIESKIKTYAIAMPPPNRTGVLHIGHAAMLAIEDILIRYHRMRGEQALWVPGTDHAAIATQTKVEKIINQEGTNRHKLGKEKFLERVRDFAQNSHDTIVGQIKKMGCSCDWSREAYTLDDARSKMVRSVFKLMYDDGLIYRGERIVNWCPRCHSTLADDEVEYKAQKAKFYTFKYSRDFPFAIATTRPETKLGDTAVAVNPKDKRYQKYIGKIFEVDFVGIKLKLKIIADRGVDMEFGAGALGVTPAHSAVDWQMAEENDLKIIKVIDEGGNICEGFGRYSGKDVIAVRKMIIAELQKQGLLAKEEEIENNLSLCYRCDTPIEPLPSEQWFIDVNKPLKGKKSKIDWEGKSIKDVCLEVVREGKIKIAPKRFEKNYFHWMENLRDWCVSRQIWFGHQVPVWHRSRSLKPAAYNFLNFRNKKFFNLIKSGKKIIETRALNPEEKGRYFGDIKTGDVLNLNYIEGKKTKEKITVKVKRVKIYKDTAEMLKEERIEGIFPYGNKENIIKFQESIPGYAERIEKNGIIAFEIKKIDPKSESIKHKLREIYVGVEPPEGKGWTQDPDTLDTWFSSGLWTFSTLVNSPDQIKIKNGRLEINSDDFKKFHPTQVLETGYDILFFWVARMIIMTTYAIGDIPFEKVYLHGLVRDEQGRKMSKSLGNAIDPLDMIKKYGTDATRLALVIGASPGGDTNLSEEKIAGYRNFVNKLWNISRYVIANYELRITNCELRITNCEFDQNKLSFSDKWILGKMNNLIKGVTDDLDNYRFSQAGEKLRAFTWETLADWYLEASKFEKENKAEVLAYVLQVLLKLWHPFIPFSTEVIWGELFSRDLLMVSAWPQYNTGFFANAQNDFKYNDFELIIEVIKAIRNARAENKVEPARKIKAVIYAGKNYELIKSQAVLIKSLRTGIKELEIKKSGKKIEDTIEVNVNGITVYLIGAIDKEKEKARLEKEIANLEKAVKLSEKKLKNKEFIANAPEKVAAGEKKRLKERKEELEGLKTGLGNL
ncbi:MAG: class I tRNA ligase family protein [Patescibacteria group bacterium]|nr:class I tRNA ligase family protein [Patescibacteria group bacterium]